VIAFALAAMLIGTLVISIPSKEEIKSQQVAASEPEDFRFTAVGDWGCKSSTTSVASLMSTKNPEVVLGLGDYSYTSKITCWHDIIASYPILHDAIHAYNSTAFGNHEDSGCGHSGCLDAEGKAEYLAHFNQPPTYFSFDHKRVHFVALDTNIAYDTSSSQYAFISADLSLAKQRKDANSIDWVVTFMHHPFYTSCVNTCTDHGNVTAIRAVYQPLFDQYNVDVVLQAHVHAYERMKPLKSGAIITHPDTFDYVNPEGQIYITVGTGGQSHYDYTSQPQMSVIQLEDIFGFLQVDVTRTTFVGRFMDTNDVVQDSFIIIKTEVPLPSPPSPPAPPPTDPGPNPPAYYFNGNNYTQVASSPSLQLSQFSVATWFNFDTDYAAQSIKRIIVNKGGFGSETSGKNMNYGIWVDFGSTNGNKIEAGFETSAGPDIFVRSPAKYKDGQWHYAVLTYDGSVLRLYIDGSQVASKSTTAVPDSTGTQPLRIGANSQALDRTYTGNADEVRVWNRALTAQEVSDQFNLGIFDTNGQVIYLTP
jgi:hypothetical protein